MRCTLMMEQGWRSGLVRSDSQDRAVSSCGSIDQSKAGIDFQRTHFDWTSSAVTV